MCDMPDLSLLGTMPRRVMAEQTLLRADIRVLTAIVMRLDRKTGAAVIELRAMNSQRSLVDGGIRTSAAQPPAGL